MLMSKFIVKLVHLLLLCYSMLNQSLAIPMSKPDLDCIQQVNNFDFFESEVLALDKNSLVIFDLKKVLLINEDPWERGFSKERSAAKTISSLYLKDSELSQKLDLPTRARLWSIYARGIKFVLVDHNVLKWIDFLKANSIKSIALTRFLAGRLGHNQSLEYFRIQDLLNKKIDFSYSFPNENNLIFKQFSDADQSPSFKNGILFTIQSASKGLLLKAFFERIKWYPNKIVMVDDKLENLESVREEAKKLNIAFTGYLYTGADKLPAYFNKAVAECQMQYLIDHELWLSAEKALKILNEKILY